MKQFFLYHFLALPFLLFAQSHNEPKEIAIDKVAFAKIILPGSPDFLAADGDDVWILNIDRVEKLSVKSSKPILTVPVPGACGALIVAYNAVWVASCTERSIYRIDKKTGSLIARIPSAISDTDGEIMLAAGDSAIWILSDNKGVLTRIDIRTNSVQTKIAVLPGSYCAVYNYNAVWITNTDSNSVQRIDPKTNTIAATIHVGKTPRFIAAGENGVWTLNQGDGTVSHIDPVSNTVEAVIDAKVPGSGGDIAAGAGAVWVRAKTRLLETIDPASNTVDTIYTPVSGSGAVRVTDHFIWVTAHDINTVWILKR
jgi:YVTN family beta-propeller protein